MKYKITSRKWLIDYPLLLIILLLYGINMYYLISNDTTPPAWDEAVHLRDSLVFYNVLSDPSQVNIEVIKDIVNKSEQYPLLRPSGYYPPLAPTLTAFLYFFFGTSGKVAIMSNVIFLFILVLSVYGIGALMFDRNVGLLASVLILLFPIVLNHSVIYYLDLPLAAMVALGVFMIIKSDYFKNTTFSLISGLCFGLGMLTKWTYLFFILGPLCYLVLKSFHSETSQENGFKVPLYSKKSFRNIILFVFVSVFTFGPYYFPILPALVEETFKYSHGAIAHGPDSLFSFASASFYPVALWKDMVTPPGFILFIIGMILLSLSKNSYKTLLFVWIIVPYLIFTFAVENKQPRYMMPWSVPISLVISFCVCEIASVKVLGRPAKFQRYAIISPFLIFFVLFFIREDVKLKNSIIDSSRGNWRVGEIVSVIEEDMTKGKKTDQPLHRPMYLGVIPDHHYINGQTLRYYAALRGLPLNVIKLQNYNGTAFQEFVEKFDKYDYVLTKNSSNIAIISFQESVDDMHKFFYSRTDRFERLKTLHEPDGSEVSIFKRRQ